MAMLVEVLKAGVGVGAVIAAGMIAAGVVMFLMRLSSGVDDFGWVGDTMKAERTAGALKASSLAGFRSMGRISSPAMEPCNRQRRHSCLFALLVFEWLLQPVVP